MIHKHSRSLTHCDSQPLAQQSITNYDLQTLAGSE